TITYENGNASLVGNNADTNALLDFTGDNNITIAAINTSDVDITGLTMDATGFTAVLDPVMHMDNTETLTITNGNDAAGTITLQEVEGNELSDIDASDFDGTLNLTLSQIDSTNDDSTPGGTNDGLLEAFTFTAGQGVTTMTLETVGANTPQLNTGSEWVFDFTGAAAGSSLTITDDVVFQAGAILTLINVPMIIDGAVDLSDVVLSVDATTTIDVPAGSSLTLTIDQAKAIDLIGAVVRGEGTTFIVGDGTDNNLGNLDWVGDSNIRTVVVDVSAVTLDTTLPLPQDADGYFDLDVDEASVPDGVGGYIDAGQIVVGSANNDRILLSSLDDTVTGGLGDDLIDLTTGGSDTVVVDAGTDTVTGLAADGAGAGADDVLQVTGATATANAVVATFIATAATSNIGTANISRGATLTDGTIDVSAAGGTKGFNLTGSTDGTASLDTLIGSAFADVINGGNTSQALGAEDILTGNGGADDFIFNIDISQPIEVVPAAAPTVAGNDDEIWDLADTAMANNDGLQSITVFYREGNGNGNFQILDDATIDFNDLDAVGDKIAAELSTRGLATIYDDINDQLLVNGAPGQGVEILSITHSVPAVMTAVEAAASDAADVPQQSKVTIGTGSATLAVAGEVYRLTATPDDGDAITGEYVAMGGETEDAIALALGTSFNTVAGSVNPVNGVVAVVLTPAVPGVSGAVLTLLDGVSDNGGFTLAASSSGGISGTGASQLLTGTLADLATADIITDFSTVEDDTISFGLAAGTGGVSGNFDSSAEVALDTYVDVYNDALAAMSGTNVVYYLGSIQADLLGNGVETVGLVFFDANNDDTPDGVVALIGVNSTNFSFSDIVA
ncbi:beta strand repeat-containing protein, partial [Zavarzinia sp.]